MENLTLVNLIQAGSVSAGILGGLLLWFTKAQEFRGISVLLFCISLASCINILEESGLTRELYLISPIFIMLFGPLVYLATKLLIDKKLASKQLWHLTPVIPFLLLTSYTSIVIGVGTLWRLTYAILTILMLIKYKRFLDEERSDSDDFSLNWLVWVLAITAAFNLVDLVRLNIQHLLPYSINTLGQGINNAVWLIVIIVITIKIQTQKNAPDKLKKQKTQNVENKSSDNNYQSIFKELDQLIVSKQWFLKPRLTLADLSQLTGLQTRDISRAINIITEKSFNEYINSYRVKFVCTLLEDDPQKGLSDISAEAGFSSKASFNKVFKQVMGVTPSNYKINTTV